MALIDPPLQRHCTAGADSTAAAFPVPVCTCCVLPSPVKSTAYKPMRYGSFAAGKRSGDPDVLHSPLPVHVC